MDSGLRELYPDVLEHGEAMLVVDAAFRVVLVNRNFEAMTRSRRADVLGRVLWEAFPVAAEAASPFRRELDRAMAERTPVEFEGYFAPLAMWTAVSAFPTRQGGLAAFFRDVTERRRYESETARSRGQFEAVFQAMRDGVVVFDMQGRAVQVNAAEALMNGYATADDMKRELDYFASVYELSHTDGRRVPVEQWPVSRVLRGESLAELELCGRRRDTGQEWIFSFSGEPVRNEAGEQVLAVVITRDITESKRNEIERERLVAALREADRRKNEFLAMLSHELRNPLAPIVNSVNILERTGSLEPAAKRARAIIHRQVDHLTRLVDDLLDVTRISQGKFRLHREAVDLAALVQAAADDAQDAFDTAGVTLRTEVTGGLTVDGDRVRLAQLAGNLLENAAKFTPRGGEAHLALAFDPAASQAVLRVRDTGVGIAAELLPRLFEPFAQATTALDRSGGGLGLGLALVRGVAELHGGAASIRSDGTGRGTEVTVRLPARLTADSDMEAAAPATAEPHHPPRRVLIIEDNADAAETLRDVLELTGGHEVAVAGTGPAGLDLARKLHPDVVLCDIGLPGMDGYQVAGRLRADPAARGMKLIALSGYAAPDDVARAKAAGFDLHLAKPPSIDSLTRAID